MMLEQKSTALNFLYLPFTLMVNHVDANQLSALGWIIILDFVSGIIKSYVLGISITKRMLDGIISKTVIFLIPLIVVLLAKGVGLDAKEFLFWIISILIVAETYGVIGNIISIKDRKQVEEKDIVNILLHNLRAMTLRYLMKDKDLK